MCFAVLEDLTGKIECIVFPKVFEEYEKFLSSREPLVLKGQVNLSESPRKFFPSKIRKLKDEIEERVTGVKISVRIEEVSENNLSQFKRVLLGHRGSVPIRLFFEHRTVEQGSLLGVATWWIPLHFWPQKLMRFLMPLTPWNLLSIGRHLKEGPIYHFFFDFYCYQRRFLYQW